MLWRKFRVIIASADIDDHIYLFAILRTLGIGQEDIASVRDANRAFCFIATHPKKHFDLVILDPSAFSTHDSRDCCPEEFVEWLAEEHPTMIVRGMSGKPDDHCWPLARE